MASMAFGSPNAATSGGGNTTAQVQSGPELPEIETEGLGFLALNGEKKLKLLPFSWPSDALPPPTSSLLSVASKKGVLAAAGPDTLVIATTESVRQTLTGSGPEENQVKAFTPQLTLPFPRLSHIAFSSNESFLVVSAESGGGLRVFHVDSLLQGKTDAAFELATNGVAVRALIPNPNPAFEELFSIILAGGQLMLAELNQRQLVNGPNGSAILKEGVSCVSWSAKGKQLVAGLGDGTAFQIQQDGVGVASIPRPPEVPADTHVSSIFWLANDEFLVIHSANGRASNPAEDNEMGDDSEIFYHFVKTDKSRSGFSFSKIPSDPCFPSENNRLTPPHHFLARLRKWAALEDILILSSTGSTDIAVLTSSAVPLAPGAPVNDYTSTMLTDARRATLPRSIQDMDTSAIGMAMDLSSKEKVLRPIPMEEEIIESPTPLPALFVLNHEGLLSAWWVVYNESIKQNVGYPGLIALGGGQQATPAAPTSTPTPAKFASPSPAPFGNPSAPAFGASGFSAGVAAFGKPSFGTPSASATPSGGVAFGKPAFGTPSSVSAAPTGGAAFGKPSFGTPSANTTPSGVATFGKPAFGTPSLVNAAPTGGAAFGKPSFGTPSASATPAFGSTGGIGNRTSIWGTANTTPQKPAAQPQQNPFSALGGASGFSKFAADTPESPFSSFGGGSNTPAASGFASLGHPKPQQSLFSAPTAPSTTTPIFGGMSTEPSFGSTVTVGSSLGGGSTLPSWVNTPAQASGSLFGEQSSFASTKESDMGDADDDAQNRTRDEATPTPQAPQEQPKGLFGAAPNGFKLNSTFKGDGSAKDDLPKPPAPSISSLFGDGFSSALNTASIAPITPIKKEDEAPKLSRISNTPEAPPKVAPGTLFSLFGSSSTATAFKPPAKEQAKEPANAAPVLPSTESPVVKEPAPLPPDPVTFKLPKGADDDLPPLAGSPAIQVEAPGSSPPSSPGQSSSGLSSAPEDDDISVEEQEEDETHRSPSDVVRRPVAQEPTWSFGDSVTASPRVPPQAPTPPVKSAASSRSRNQSRSPSRSPVRSIFQKSSTPAGFPKPGPIFPPPSHVQDALRSPSPVRSASTSAIGTRRRPEATAPGPAARPSLLQTVPKAPSPPPPQVSDLSDDDDERIREELGKPVVANRRLDPFVAHQDYTGSVTKAGIPGQIERVYRDINSMIDTLGINARSLASFIKAHNEPQRHNELTRDDLDRVFQQGEDGAWVDEWCLVELEDLWVLENELEQTLEAGRLTDVHDKLLELSGLDRAVAKLRTRVADMKQQIKTRAKSNNKEYLRMQPLPKEQAEQQRALRDAFASMMKNLSDAEEAVVLLRTRLAAKGEKLKPKQVPTVEAVENTIRKMTAMVEKKSGDIDVLEQQMKKLGLLAKNGEGGGVRALAQSQLQSGARDGSPARDASPFATPPSTSRGMMAASTRLAGGSNKSPSKTFGLFYTPDGTPSKGSVAGAREDNDVDLSEETLQHCMEMAAKRKVITNALAAAVVKRGRKVTRVGG
ncbi:hypothetical protein K432DRAFT_439690 [Lepidopterella palustris CBS 459.81]|uniref:Nucleoporin Nup159/Nup146 N-terminal domain-containing protein n=1 Tax=Lepidopterella palustris CBS 459.81 TaxID=1314670 RepID=A0A8E2EJ04_9PEZI|nr:hypothetical protein K432DRAFT_439690 [Lepidopterella palustris CBS 459.81]